MRYFGENVKSMREREREREIIIVMANKTIKQTINK